VPFYSDTTLTGVDPLAKALGYKNWNFSPAIGAGNGTAPTSQTIYCSSLWLPVGTVCTGVVIYVVTAAAGNKPTSFSAGLCTATKMVAQSAADVSGNAGAPFAAQGENQIALTGTYTTNASDSSTGLYYLLLLQNGSYSVTQPQFGRNVQAIPPLALSGQALPWGTAGTGQTALPANGAAVTIVATNGLGFFAGIY